MRRARELKGNRVNLLFIALAFLIILLCSARIPLTVDDSETIESLDAVVVLAGSRKRDAERVSGGVKLLKSYRAKYLILPLRHKSLGWDWFVERYGINEPIKPSEVIIGGVDSTVQEYLDCCGGTYAEAVKTYQLISNLDVKNLAVVSSSYHLLRAKMAFNRVFPNNSEYRLFFVPEDRVKTIDFLWWLSGSDFLAVMREYKKLAGGYFLYKSYQP